MMKRKIQQYLAGVLCGVMFLSSSCGTHMQVFAKEETDYLVGETGDVNTDEDAEVSLSGNDGSVEDDGSEEEDAPGVDGESEGENGIGEGNESDIDDGSDEEVSAGEADAGVSGNDVVQEEEPDSELAALSAENYSADNIFRSGTYENITWTIDLDGKLTVEGSGEFSSKWNNTSTRAPWHDYGSAGVGYIKTAEVNVTDCKNLSYMFDGCSDLTYADLSGSDLSCVTNMKNMFNFCTRLEDVDFGASEIRDVTNISMFGSCHMLKSVDMSHFHTSNVTDMSGLFKECWALTSVVVGEFNTGNVTNMSNMFYNCKSLLNLDISGFDTGNVTNMYGMFYNCSSLANLDVRGFDTANVTDMANMFYNCSGLTTLDVDSFDTANVTDMSNMFYNCGKLTALDVNGFHMGNVTKLAGMFANCRSLESVDISHFDIKGVTSLDNLFSGCSKLKSVSLVCTGESSITSISNLFSGCSSLTSVSLSGFDNNKITNMSRLFYGCRDLQSIDLNHFSTVNVTDMSYMFSGCSGLTELNLDGFQASAAQNMSHMFEGCNKLERLDLSGLSTANAENMSYLFSNCYNLQNINLEPLDTSKVTNMSHMFSGCSKLTEVSMKNLNTANVRDMAYMFYSCAVLADIDVKNFDTSNVMDMSYMFSGCKSLKTLDTSGFSGGSVTSTEYMFYNCTSLAALDLSNFGAGSLTTTECMFQNCEALKSLNLKGFKASKAVTMEYMFSKCYDLESINLEEFDTSNVENMKCMFQECVSLKKLDVSSFNTSRVKTMWFMFNNCGSLEELDLSSFDTGRVTTMQGMVSTCKSLKYLDVSGFNTSNVTSMNGMFTGDAALKSLDVSSFDTSSVTDMSFMFTGCRGLTNIDLSHFDTARVENMQWMFFACDELKSLDLGGFDMSRVTNANSMFFGSPKLSRIYTPCNLGVVVGLPYSMPDNMYNEVWYQADGTKIQHLPMNLSYSIVIEKNKKPAAQAARLEVSKTKTAYECGEILNLDDLTVKYRDGNGVLSVVTEYTTNASEIDMNVPGKKTLKVSYRANGSTLTASVELTVTYVLEAQKVTVTVEERECVYDGTPVTPSVAVRVVLPDGTERTLVSGEDYTVSYRNNINAYGNGTDNEVDGTAPEARITGIHDYKGSVTVNFLIRKAMLTITARTHKVAVGEDFPDVADSYAYDIKGLFGKDTLIKEPVFTVIDAQGNAAVVDTSRVGASYTLVPEGADAGPNYDISYRSGMIVIVEDKYSYTVLFKTDAAQTDTSPYAAYYDIASGSLLEAPEEPEIAGFHFAGWYTDKEFVKPWNFETDIVQEDMTLYACLLRRAAEENDGGLRLCVQDITPQAYTGSAVKPKIMVYAADGVTPLKAGKDYTIKYANNVAAVTTKEDGTLPDIGTAAVQNSGKQETLQMLSGSFTKDCPYVIITGRGNYTETIYKNFYILPVNISADGNMQLATGFTMKYSEQLVKSNKKSQNPFTSLKYKKAMKLGTDYTLTLKANGDVTCDSALTTEAVPQEWVGQTTYNSKNKKYTAPAIPTGYAGTFTLTVTGKGNYTGKVIRHIYLADDASGLMKNARITLGKNQKKVAFLPGGVCLSPGFYDAEQKKYYAVEDGKETERENGNDIFTVSVKSGGKTNYLKYSSKETDSDYFISYRNNDRAGTATLTLSGNPQKGYFGSKSITFKITGVSFSAGTVEVKDYDVDHPDEKDWKASMPYTGRAVTQNKVTLTTKVTQNNSTAQKLTYGEHYTIAYKNNVKKGTATMIFTAKPESGYSGSFKKTFKITAQNLDSDMFARTLDDGTIQHRQLPVVESDEKKNSMTVKWDEDAVYAKNGASLSFILCNPEGMVLKPGTDYTVSYRDHKTATKEKVGASVITGIKQPIMTVKGKGNYGGTLIVQFQITPTSIASDRLTVSAAQVQKKNGMKLKDFKLKVIDGKAVLKEGTDYRIDDAGCTPEIIKAYADSLGTAGTAPEPKLVLTGIGNYGAKAAEGEGADSKREISLADYIYTTKLTSKNLRVEVTGDRTYTGQNVEPAVKVSFYKDNDAAKQDGIGAELTMGTDYKVTYGSKNVTAGKNKGSVTITGAGIYGGSVTVKFDIEKKRIY